MHYLLVYELASDYLERRAQFRKEHLEIAWQSAGRGELVIAGALEDPTDTAILMFNTASEKVPAAFAEADPYVRNGLVKKWSVRRWNTVVGEAAGNPVRLG